MNNEKYKSILFEACTMAEITDEGELHLELTSALKQAASNHGIAYGEEMRKFLKWADKQLEGSK